ncbi:MAG: PIN domain-containing protein [Burkholderiaceae bacterium]
MKILFDTNVVLDVLEQRKPHFIFSAPLMNRVEQGTLTGLLCATTFATIAYLTERYLIKEKGKTRIEARAGTTVLLNMLLKIFDIAPVTRAVIDRAGNSQFEDFDDGVLHESAVAAGVDGIVTKVEKTTKNRQSPSIHHRNWKEF